MKDWYHYRQWNLTHRAQLRESGHMTYHTTAVLPNSCGPMADGPFRDPRVGPIHTPNIGPIDVGWYQYRPWNLTHRAQLRESGHMTYHTTALLPNSCGPMADGPFRDAKGRSYPRPKYWTHLWRIWYQYRPWNLTHRAQLRESGHMTSYDGTTTKYLQPNGGWSISEP